MWLDSYSEHWLRVMIGQFTMPKAHSPVQASMTSSRESLQAPRCHGSGNLRVVNGRVMRCSDVFGVPRGSLSTLHWHPSATIQAVFSPSGITPVVPQARMSTLEWFAITQCIAPLQGFPQHPDRAKIQTTRSIQHYNDTELLRTWPSSVSNPREKMAPCLLHHERKINKHPAGHRHNIDMNHMNPRNQK